MRGEVTVALVPPDQQMRLAALRRAWAEEQAGEPVADESFEARFVEWARSARRITWVASAAGRDVGMLNLAVFERMPKPGQEPNRWGYVGNVFVLGSHRNAGVGRLLLNAVVEHARANDFVRLVLSPSERSVPFYERAGFRPANSLLMFPLDDDRPGWARTEVRLVAPNPNPPDGPVSPGGPDGPDSSGGPGGPDRGSSVRQR